MPGPICKKTLKKNCTTPAMTQNKKKKDNQESPPGFRNFGLAEKILRALDDQGYTTPTPIQLKAIPVILEGRDVMGVAQTGTGKTAGFSLPVIEALLPLANTSVSPARHPVRALVLTPTRELANQVADSIRKYARYTGLRSAVVFGGVDMAAQSTTLQAGVEILIATPGRLLDHIQQKSVSLSQTKILILDEADRMLDMGFLPDIQRIINLLPKKRQNLMFSATFSPEIKKLASGILVDPETIEASKSSTAAENVSQTVYQVDEAHKNEAIVHILKGRSLKQVLVFTNTRVGAARLTRMLEKKNIRSTAIHGDKSQPERMAALEAFKKGDYDVMVATDVAARGLDIVELPCVINYDLPFTAEDYVHRIGRTGRAGAAGDAISLYSVKDERCLADIEKLIKQKLPRQALPGFDDKTESPAKSTSQPGPAAKRPGKNSPYHSVPLKRKPQRDSWFDKPYEPSATPQAKEKDDLKPEKQPKKKIAALLGGLAKK